MTQSKARRFLTPLSGARKVRRYATYDIETTPDLQRVYLLGFFDGESYRYFESEPTFPELDGSAVDRFLTWLFGEPNYCGWWLYAHNGGNFDALYLIRWLLERQDRYRLEVTPVQATVLCLEVMEKTENREPRKWIFIDSLRLMNAGLDRLGKAFGLGGKLG